MRRCIALTLLVVGGLAIFAHDIITTKLTYTRDVRPILAQRCLSCHGPSNQIPLTSYQEVRPWAVDIKEQVLERKMPPWGAVKGFGEFMNDEALPQQEIQILSAWVVGGSPEGSRAYLRTLTVPKAPQPPVAESVFVDAHRPLRTPLTVVGVEPVPKDRVESARIVARKPDGEIVPLVWLYQYGPEYKKDFQFAKPVFLPRGTVVDSPVPVRLDLPLRAPKHQG